MEPSHVRRLEENRDFVQKNLVIGNNMMEHLLAEDVIGYSDSCRSDIDNMHSERRKTSRLIDALLQKDEKAFEKFVQVLQNKDVNMGLVASKLTEDRPQEDRPQEDRPQEDTTRKPVQKVETNRPQDEHRDHEMQAQNDVCAGRITTERPTEGYAVAAKLTRDARNIEAHNAQEIPSQTYGCGSNVTMVHCPDRRQTLSSCKPGQKKDITHYHHIGFRIVNLKPQCIYRIKAEPQYADYGQRQLRKNYEDFKNIEIIHRSYNDCQLSGSHRGHYDIWLCFISTGYQVEYGMEFSLMEKSKDNKEYAAGQPIFHKFLVSATDIHEQDIVSSVAPLAQSGRLQNEHYIATIKQLTVLTEGRKDDFAEFFQQKTVIEAMFGNGGQLYRPEYIASIKLIESKVAYMNNDIECAKRLAKQAAGYCKDIPGADGLALCAYCLQNLSCHYRFQKNWEKTKSVLDQSFQQVMLIDPCCDRASSYFNCARMLMDQSAMYLDRLKDQSEQLRHLAVDMFKKAIDVITELDSLENPINLDLLQRCYLNMAMTYLNVPYHANLQPVINQADLKKAEECLMYIQKNLMHDIYDRTKCHVLKLQANLEFMKGNLLEAVDVMEEALCLAQDSQLSLDVKFCQERLDAMRQCTGYIKLFFSSQSGGAAIEASSANTSEKDTWGRSSNGESSEDG